MADLLIVAGVLLLILAFCLPARVKIRDGNLDYGVWPFIPPKTRPIEDLESYSLTIGLFPIRLRFKDGSEFKWTSYPLGKHERLRREIERCQAQKSKNHP